MMKLQDLLQGDGSVQPVIGQVAINPLADEDALQEAQLLDVRFDALTLTVGLLFEMRTALQLREVNTGVIVARGVREITWSGPSREPGLTAWVVGSSLPSEADGLFRLRLSFWPAPGALFDLISESAAYFAVDVPSLGDVPPDYVNADRGTVSAGIASWTSPFETLRSMSRRLTRN